MTKRHSQHEQLGGQDKKNLVPTAHLTPRSGQDFLGSEWLCSHLPDTRHQTATSGTWTVVSGEGRQEVASPSLFAITIASSLLPGPPEQDTQGGERGNECSSGWREAGAKGHLKDSLGSEPLCQEEQDLGVEAATAVQIPYHRREHLLTREQRQED